MDVAIHLAQWCSPYFAVKVSELVRRYVKGQVTTEESRAAVSIAQKAIDDAEADSRKRKMLLDEEEHAKKMKMKENELASRERELAIQKRERDDLMESKERELAIQLQAKERELDIRDRDPEYKINLYISTFRNLGLELDGTDRILHKDLLRNAVAPPGHISGSQAPRVLNALLDMAADRGHLAVALACMRLSQVIRALPND